MAAAVGARGRCELPPRSGPGWLLGLAALLSTAARGAVATTHWVVTEDGKIQQQVGLRRPCPPARPAGPRPGMRGGFPARPLAVGLRAAPPPAHLPAASAPGRPRRRPSPRPLQALGLPLVGPRAAWGASPGRGGAGPGGAFSRSGVGSRGVLPLRLPLVPSGPRVASPRGGSGPQGAAPGRGGGASGPGLGVCACGPGPPSPSPPAGIRSGRGGFTLRRGPGRRRGLLPKEGVAMPPVASPHLLGRRCPPLAPGALGRVSFHLVAVAAQEGQAIARTPGPELMPAFLA